MSNRSNLSREGALAAVNAELAGEKAATLGRSGQTVEAALQRLSAFDATGGSAEDRADLVKAATTAVWHFFIQREVCGFRDQRPVIAQYGIPREVLKRLGAL